MTITCSNCDMPYLIVTDDPIVACPYCGTRTFSPGADDGDDDEEEQDARAQAAALAQQRAGEEAHNATA